MSYHENHTRSIYKAISYRILSVIIDSVFVYGITGKPKTTLGIVLATNFYSTFVYYAHERVWNHFHFGKKAIHKTVSKSTIRKKRVSAKKTTKTATKTLSVDTKSEISSPKKGVRKTTSRKREVAALV